jgi:hypothetical protein
VESSHSCSRSTVPTSVRTWRIVRLVGVDSPRGSSWPGVLRVLREFLRVFRSIHFVGGFLLHEVHGRSVLECRMVRDRAVGPRAHRRRSVIEGAVLEVWDRFSDSPS